MVVVHKTVLLELGPLISNKMEVGELINMSNKDDVSDLY